MEDGNTTSESHQDPTPLSLEGGAKQLDLGINPPPAPKSTPVSYPKKGFIKSLIGTPKEKGADEPGEPSTSGSGQAPPKEPTQSIISRLDGEGGDKGSSSSEPPPSPEESKDGAGMLIDGFNALFIFFVGIWSKDPDTKDYEVETEEKNKLKKYLGAIMQRSGKSIPPLWLFIGLMLIMYVPMLKKGYDHKKRVDEQRAKDKPGTIIIDSEPRRRRRRNRGNDDDAQFYHAEEVK